MLNVQNKLTDAQVNNHFYLFVDFYFYFIQKRALSHLSTNIPSFKNLARQITSNSDGFDKWLNTTEIATQVPVVWENNGDKMNEISSAVYS
jgi:hypothetical protein